MPGQEGYNGGQTSPGGAGLSDPSVLPFRFDTRGPGEPGLARLALVHRGACRVEYSGRGRTLLPGGLLLVPQGVPVATRHAPDAGISVVSFPRSFLDPLALGDQAGAALSLLAAPEPTAVRLGPEDGHEARTLFELIRREWETRRPGCESMVRLKLLELLVILFRARGGDSEAAPGQRPGFDLDDATRYLREHCAEELTLAGVAARYGLSAAYFSRLFHERMGLPLVQYLNRVRIERACLLLKRTDAAISEIALTVGYNNLSHFNRCFRRAMGSTPRAWRVAAGR